MNRESVVKWIAVAIALLGFAIFATQVSLAQSPDTSFLACPAFHKDATGKTVRTTSCTYKVQAPSSPGVDQICARQVGGTGDLRCVPALAGRTVDLVLTPAAAGRGHVVFQVYSIDSDANVGTGTPSKLESGPSDRSGILVDLDLATILQVIVNATTTVVP